MEVKDSVEKRLKSLHYEELRGLMNNFDFNFEENRDEKDYLKKFKEATKSKKDMIIWMTSRMESLHFFDKMLSKNY